MVCILYNDSVLSCTIAQTSCTDAQRVGHSRIGATCGAVAPTSWGAASILRGVRRIWWGPWIWQRLTVLCSRWLGTRLRATTESREWVVTKLHGKITQSTSKSKEAIIYVLHYKIP